ncbi:putative PH domain containing protein [Blattamonas nauphoetae]|uniref:PH domain containing protein n=1 Tax=Blattamonas nauphoetae TaxID=2049346 RepID=A0ABQ9YKH9_9EUKA|nr:putative PH domain containing protein [Blattamonas nauphoetae]
MSHQGWILKEGGSGIFTNWKRRWAVLDPSTGNLNYYEKEDVTTQPLGVVLIRGSFITECDKKTKKKDNVFVITSAGRTFFAQAESKEDMDTWISKLHQVASSVETVNKKEDKEQGVSDSTSLFAGWLTKEAGSGGKWRKRWFILRPKDLSYYKEKTSTEAQGSVDIRGAKILTSSDLNSDKPYLFHLETVAEGSRTYHLEARNAAEYQFWIDKLQDAISRHGDPQNGGGSNSNQLDDVNAYPESDDETGKARDDSTGQKEFYLGEEVHANAILKKINAVVNEVLEGWEYTIH